MPDGSKFMLFPSFDAPFSGHVCEMCGWTFVDMTPQEEINAHYLRHIDEAVERHHRKEESGHAR